MKRLALFAAVSALLAASVAHAATPSGPGKPTVTLNYLEIQTSFAATIPENQRPKFGDQFSFHSEFYKWNGAKRGAHVGHVDVTAVLLTSNVFQITAVAFLPGGTLAVVGQAGNQRVQTFPVVGGTGIYATARRGHRPQPRRPELENEREHDPALDVKERRLPRFARRS